MSEMFSFNKFLKGIWRWKVFRSTLSIRENSLPLKYLPSHKTNSKCLFYRKGTRTGKHYYAFLCLGFFFKFLFDLFELKKNKIMNHLLQNQKAYSHKHELQKIVLFIWHLPTSCWFPSPIFFSVYNVKSVE